MGLIPYIFLPFFLLCVVFVIAVLIVATFFPDITRLSSYNVLVMAANNDLRGWVMSAVSGVGKL